MGHWFEESDDLDSVPGSATDLNEILSLLSVPLFPFPPFASLIHFDCKLFGLGLSPTTVCTEPTNMGVRQYATVTQTIITRAG